MTTYRHCLVKKNVGNDCYLYQTSFIPDKYCKYKVIKLKKEDGTWEDGWEFECIGKDLFTEEQVSIREWRLSKRK